MSLLDAAKKSHRSIDLLSGWWLLHSQVCSQQTRTTIYRSASSSWTSLSTGKSSSFPAGRKAHFFPTSSPEMESIFEQGERMKERMAKRALVRWQLSCRFIGPFRPSWRSRTRHSLWNFSFRLVCLTWLYSSVRYMIRVYQSEHYAGKDGLHSLYSPHSIHHCMYWGLFRTLDKIIFACTDRYDMDLWLDLLISNSRLQEALGPSWSFYVTIYLAIRFREIHQLNLRSKKVLIFSWHLISCLAHESWL